MNGDEEGEEPDVDSADESGSGSDRNSDVTDLAAVSAEMREVAIEARAASVLDPKPWLQADGTFDDENGRLNYEARGAPTQRRRSNRVTTTVSRTCRSRPTRTAASIWNSGTA